MFNDISESYDFLNHLLSFGTDIKWRRKFAGILAGYKPADILDVATGTADLAIEVAHSLPDCRITGIDLSEGMLGVASQKCSQIPAGKKISLIQAAAESLPFSSEKFDAAMAAFGVRNFENTLLGMREMYRVLKPGGTVLILEFSLPGQPVFRQIFLFYFRFILPLIARLFTRNPKAYTYLRDTVLTFPYGNQFVTMMETAGFRQCNYLKMSMGIACIYMGRKEKNA